MRPLHRPMFRYGGPIKEGVMSGIREPQAKHTVGSSIWPQTDGRTHQGKIGTGGNILSKVPGGSSIVSKISSSTKDLFPRIGQWWRNIKPSYRTQPGVVTGGTSHKGIYGTGASGTKAKYISQTMPPVSKMSKIKAFAKENPWWTYGGAGAGVSSGVVPTVAGGIADLGWRGVKQVGDLLVWDKIFDQDKWEAERKAKKELENELKTTTETNPWKDKYEALLAANETPQKSDDERRAERIQKYRDIMDIKGMNKEAAYDSLIAASKAVGESGDFKGDIKSGKLINDIIQSTSKAFDKPKKTKDAIDTLILKGEIEKDLYAAKPSEAEKAAAAFGISKEEYKKKLLGKSSAAEYIATSHAKTGRVDSTTVASGYKASGIVPKATITDTIVDDWIDDNSGKTEIDYVKEVISKADGFGPGLYVVGDRAVLFDGTTYKYDY